MDIEGVLASMENRGELRRADMPKFGSEDDALAYAKRIAGLKPGDEVWTKTAEEGVIRSIFFGHREGRAVLLRFDDDKELGAMTSPLGSLIFPD